MSAEKVEGTMSTIRWWYESLQWEKPEMRIQEKRRERKVQIRIEDLLAVFSNNIQTLG